MQSDRQLKMAYSKYNKLYFNNELPDNTVLIWEPTPKNDAVCCPVYEVVDNCFEIKIDPALKGEPAYWRMVLLHEMIHVAIWRKHPKHQHGKVFTDEKDRIYALGALRKLW
jgi:hypothetical protein